MLTTALRQPGARLHLRPTAFIDAPFGYDGRALRLAGGLLWFSAVEAIAAVAGKRVATAFVPVLELDNFLGDLPGDHPEQGRALARRLTDQRPPLQLGERTIRLDQPQAMAILNVTPDSFSDGGGLMNDPATAADRAVAMAADGAAIVDIGGESTRPGAQTVWEGDEIARIRPVIERLRASGTALSIDTRKAGVMESALAAGAHMINDVSALTWDDRALEIATASQVPVVLVHYKGTPETMQGEARYEDALIEVYEWLEARVAAAEAAGIARSRILVDPGLGFGKTLRHNLAILNGLSLFHGIGCGVVLGASRKRSIGALSNEAPVEQRLGGSVALALVGANQGVQLLRVHDVFETVQALRVWRGLRDAALTPVA
ncbi:MAG: dihydropteroate synthase [Sphingomonadaceae bacterium]|nr:dihydropteroate synthase [Sphingomonadaceae bacterium]